MKELYQVKYNEEDPENGLEVYGVSIVDTPANMEDFVMLSSKKIELKSTEKQMLVGVVLKPNQIIDRGDFNLVFDANTIEQYAHNFIKKGYVNNSKYNHVGDWLDGITIVESWIVNDPVNDKLNSLGFNDLEVGTWAIAMKVSDEIWTDYVKSGKVKGFSIDSFLRLEKIKMTHMKKESFLKRLINMLNEAKDVKLIAIGDYSTDALEVGSEVYDMNGDLAKNVEIEQDGKIIKTDDSGKIVSIEDKPIDVPAEVSADAPVDAPADAPVDAPADVPADAPVDPKDEEIAALKAEIEILIAKINELEMAKMESIDMRSKLVEEITNLKESIKTPKVKANLNETPDKPLTQRERLMEIVKKNKK